MDRLKGGESLEDFRKQAEAAAQARASDQLRALEGVVEEQRQR